LYGPQTPRNGQEIAQTKGKKESRLISANQMLADLIIVDIPHLVLCINICPILNQKMHHVFVTVITTIMKSCHSILTGGNKKYYCVILF
jgi:hypothetical protein